MEGEAGGGREAALARATIQLRCHSPREARVLWDAVRAEGDILVITAGPDPMPSLRVTLDDVMACLQAASGATDATIEIEEVD